jgi:crotonobetainyl-CoA:carnitine CoA-transferase CaiB-like acyl-CoA transferase
VTGILAGLTVVDLTSGVAGGVAGKLLADQGAELVMLEPPGGSPLRRHRPVPAGGAYGALFAYLSGGKQSVIPEDRQGADELLSGLLARADLILRDGTSPYESQLPRPDPDGVVDVDFSAFGRTGPYADWRTSDLTLWAMGGYQYFTGDPRRAPLWIPGAQAQLHAGVHGAFVALAALYERRRSGLGQAVEVRAVEAVLGAHCWLVSRWLANGVVMRRTSHGLTPTRDGWVYGMVPIDPIPPNPAILRLIGRSDLAEHVHEPDRRQEIAAAMDGWAAGMESMEIFAAAHAAGLMITPVFDAAGVASNEQLAAREWWERDEDPVHGHLTYPGQPFRLTERPGYRRGPAPLPGEHTRAVQSRLRAREGMDGRVPRAQSERSDATSGGPLTGVRVIEVSTNWAAPVCCRYLADLGADVLKVEWAARPATRIEVVPGSPPDAMTEPYNRSLYFNELNRNKRELVLDLSAPQGAEILKELVRGADVLVENQRATVMPKLGLGYDVLSEINPGLVMVSMSAFGADGPWRDRGAMGSNFEGTSGLSSVVGYDDDQPYRTSMFYGDPIGGVYGALAAMVGLVNRAATGRGQKIDIALNECVTSFFCEPLMAHFATGSVPRPTGNRSTQFAPQGVYRCSGFDNWVAVSVQSDEEWISLCAVIGRPEWGTSASPLAGEPQRHKRHDEIDAAIEDWTCTHSQYEVAQALQKAGVAAAPVLANWQVLADPHLHSLGFYVSVEHPAVGVYPQASWPWHLARTPASVRRAAPLFGQHNREILAELGRTDLQIEQLYEAAVTADRPAPEAIGNYFASTVRPPGPPDHSRDRRKRDHDATSE